jgi:hypothetical protein
MLAFFLVLEISVDGYDELLCDISDVFGSIGLFKFILNAFNLTVYSFLDIG